MDAQAIESYSDYRKKMIALARIVNLRSGIPLNPQATAEQVQAMMLAEGVRPEDNAFSRDIICQRNAEIEE